MALNLLRFSVASVIVLLAFSVTGATARPCKTFLISSYTIRNPSSNTFATITEIRSLTPLHILPHQNDDVAAFFDHVLPLQEEPDLRASLPRAPLGFSSSSYDFASLRDRTKDILSVVLALLFGVGCGALTAATMYLVWSVFAGRRDFRFDDYSDDEIESPKKAGYVKIPAAEEVVAAAPAPAVTKDSV